MYGRDYAVKLYPTKYGQALTIAAIRSIRLDDHNRIATGCLRLRPSAWALLPDPRTAPERASAHWAEIEAAWRALTAAAGDERGAPGPDPRQSLLLDMLDKVIDATEAIEIDSAQGATYPYRKVDTTGERRQGAHSMYVFHLADDSAPEEDEFVQVHGEPSQRGQVTRVDGRAVTVRFDTRIDWADLGGQGRLDRTESRIVYAKQREAVETLRTRQSRNPHLLDVLTYHRTRGFRPVQAEPTVPLDPDQLTAFRRAVAVDDLFVIQGPPGTGKTRTISQIARAAAELPAKSANRVLITSHSNRAVDNVLPKLPGHLTVVRVGNAGKVTADGLPYLLENQAADLREQVLDGVDRAMSGYRDVAFAAQWAERLSASLNALGRAAAAEDAHRADLAAARRAVGGDRQFRWEASLAAYQHGLRRADDHDARLERLRSRLDRARARLVLPLIGPLFGWYARRLERRADAAGDEAVRSRAEAARLHAAVTEAERALHEATRDHPAVRAAADRVDGAAQERARHRDDAVAAVAACREALLAVMPLEPVPPVADTDEQERRLHAAYSLLSRGLPLYSSRARLLEEWRDAVSGSPERLHSELIRYADVVAATCIGAASRPEVSELDFDLAIVDEAGQIGVPDVLVPLTRARRGVLVGDHMQLPPFLDTEVEHWGRRAGDPAIVRMLTTSALEQLVHGLPAEHSTMLTVQRRMPAAIAEFASDRFYARRLETAGDREHSDPVFAAPFAFVDTSRLPERRRREVPGGSGRYRERWGQKGYHNPAEAELLVRLAEHYHRRGAEWAVIVGYQAQRRAVMSELNRLVGDAELVRLNVGTVDSFQGGERDVVLFGFTRSNPDGKVGFLRELRRLNVAFTRAKRQLVLVGDMSTLVSATDPPFRELAIALRDHLLRVGDVHHHQAITARLRRGSEAGDLSGGAA
ncbi:DEAD/DEAH box helicase [Allonocardiopsis opalescens]|uniref:DEAD/DEAH box helicase n=1 Tax=Allonocardiopsis opalescens TaxID=1144618 RepID=UPI00147529C9|nr:AAA domain-containing protein [Allonocardiopsis opalescens]